MVVGVKGGGDSPEAGFNLNFNRKCILMVKNKSIKKYSEESLVPTADSYPLLLDLVYFPSFFFLQHKQNKYYYFCSFLLSSIDTVLHFVIFFSPLNIFEIFIIHRKQHCLF